MDVMSETFIAGAPVNKIVIVGGGFKMQSSVPVSFFASCSKRTAWKTCTTPHATGKPGKEMVTWMIPKRVPQGNFSSYNVTDVENCNEARRTTFFGCRSPKALPR